MPWVKLSDHYVDDWRLADVSGLAESVFVRLVACSNRMLADGWLDCAIVRQQAVARTLDPAAADAVVDELARVGLLHDEDVGGRAGWRLAAEFIAWQPTRASVERDRERWRAEQQRHRDAARPKRRRRRPAAENGQQEPQDSKQSRAAGLHRDVEASPQNGSSPVNPSPGLVS